MIASMRFVPSQSARRCVAGALLQVLVVSGCAGNVDFDPSSEANFVQSCVRSSNLLTQRFGLREPSVPQVTSNIASFVSPPRRVALVRDFDPSVPIPIAGLDAMDSRSPEALCASAWPDAAAFVGVDALTAFTVGNARMSESASIEQSQMRLLRRQIAGTVTSDTDRLRSIRRRLSSFSPKVSGVRVLDAPGNKHYPSVVIDVFNPTDRPIDGLVLTLFAKAADGAQVGAGRTTFRLPVPLSSGIQSSYELSLAGMSGLDTPAVVSAFANFGSLSISLNDVLVDGASLLDNLVADPADARRLGAIDVVIARIEDLRVRLVALRRRGEAVR